jgi:transposase
MKMPEPIEIEEAEVARLIEQAQQGRLDAAAQKRIVPLLRTLLWLERTLLETRISLAKIKKILFGKRTEKPRRKPRQPPDGSAGSGGDCRGKSDPPSDAELLAAEAGDVRDGRQSETQTEVETPSGEQTGVGNAGQALPPPRGHGRLGAADYPGAETHFCPHDTLAAGDRCPACMRARLYRSRPLVRLRFTGQPLAKVTH